MDKKISEAIKISDGQPKYVIKLQQNESALQVYMHRGDIYFENNEYSFKNYNTFDFCNEAHILAKEIFLSSLKTYVKNEILKIKQLEIILNDLGLTDVITETISTEAPRLTMMQKITKVISN